MYHFGALYILSLVLSSDLLFGEGYWIAEENQLLVEWKIILCRFVESKMTSKGD